MRNRRAADSKPLQVLAAMVARLTDGFRDFIRLAKSESDATLPVSDDHQSAEAEAATTLDDLGASIDENKLLDQFRLRLTGECTDLHQGTLFRILGIDRCRGSPAGTWCS